MPNPEDRPGPSPFQPDRPEPLFPARLPPDLAEFLREQQDYACLTHATNEGTAYVIKAPSADFPALRGTIPIGLRHELFDHPAAPVIRTLLTIHDRPDQPLRFETFCNVAAADQRADFAALADRERVLLLFYDEQLRHRLTKLVPYPDRQEIPRILARADAFRAAIPPRRYDFNYAKAAVLRHTTL